MNSTEQLPRHLAPYDLYSLNYLGVNYCENIFDMRVNSTSFSHLWSDSSISDGYSLQYMDDSARFMEGVAWEAEFSPVVRLELARRITKGLMAAHIPGTKAYNAFRHKSNGKFLLIQDDAQTDKQGRLTMSSIGDYLEGLLKVGFRAEVDKKWMEINQFKYTETPEFAASHPVARSPKYWNQSPYAKKRHFTADGTKVEFTGREWLADEDKPLEYEFSSTDVNTLQIVIGEPGKPSKLLGDSPGIIHLPDRKTTFASDKIGDKVFVNPKFNYMILRKATSWATWGYSSALVVMWSGKPSKIEAIAPNGYGEIRISYAKKNGKAEGKVWLYPISILNDQDMEYLYRNAENFLKNGKLLTNGYATNDMINAIPQGLAAGAYMLTRYNDPMAPTARINAQNAVDAVFDAENRGLMFVRVYFPVRAAAWMIKAGKAAGDQEMVQKYTPLLDMVVKRMLSSRHGYDGKAWPGGWDHFNAMKALFLAYDATGNEEYRAAWERGLSVYTIDEKGIYRYGVKMDAPGGFDTYSGSMPLAVWGNAGMLDYVDKLINLDVPNGWWTPEVTLKNKWNDAGAGPWAQDDANPEYVGISLKGANIPQDKKYVIPVGAFPTYDKDGKVEITYEPIVDNPYFIKGTEKVRELINGNTKIKHNVAITRIEPGSADEAKYLVSPDAGTVKSGKRVCAGSDKLVYRFDSRGAIGAGIDMELQGMGFKIDVSPDGKRWFESLDTWSDNPSSQSLDLSFLTGSRDEFVKALYITPPTDGKQLVSSKGSMIADGDRRYIAKDGELVYKLNLSGLKECRLELMLGNGYKVQCSSDGKKWNDELNYGGVNEETDAAWIKMLDVTDYLKKSDTVYLRLTDSSTKTAFNGRGAFIQRIRAYGIYNSGEVFVRISNTSKKNSFTLDNMTFRTWKD
ncbi:MAG: hypothetical protein ACYC27_05425 [Armatimonadota bacterium]